MRLSKSRKLWISTRSNYFQIEILTFYVTENMPATTAWQPTHRLERALGRPDRARRSVGERHRARTDCGSAEGRTRAICCGDPPGKAEPPRQEPIKARTSFSSTNRCMGSLDEAMKSKRS